MSTLSLAKASAGLAAQETLTGTGRTGKATVGTANEDRLYPLANIVAAVKIAAAANGNVATLTASSGAVAQTTGSPVITDAGIDSSGDALPTLVKVQAIRIRTGAAIPGGTANTGTVTLGGSSSGLFPAQVLQNDSDLLIRFPAAGLTVGAATISFTFSASGDRVLVEYLGKDS